MRRIHFSRILRYKRISPNSDKKRDQWKLNQKKEKKICKIEDFAGSPDHGVKIKENKKKDKYLDFIREWKKL